MKVLKTILLSCLILLPLAMTAACTEEETPFDTSDVSDVPTDRPPDTITDTMPDTTPDVTPDVVPDVTPDVVPDTTDVPDVPVDISPDIPPDTTGCTIDRDSITFTEQYCDTLESDYIYTGIFDGTSTTPPASIFGVELWPGYGGPTSAGTYTFDATNYATCGLCGIVSVNCTTDSCERTFLITSGTFNLTNLGAVGEQFTATITNASGIEVTIDPSTYTSTPVTGGQTFCVDSVTLSATVVLYEG